MFKRGIPSKSEPFISVLIGILFVGIVFLTVLFLFEKGHIPYQMKLAPTNEAPTKETVLDDKKENGLHIITYSAKNVRTTDGDTLAVTNNGKVISIRLLYIDTPESTHPDKKVQAYGKKASDFTRNLIKQAEQVDLIVTGTDKYERVLALVQLDGISLQKTLLINGFARIAYVHLDQPSDTDETNSYKKEQLSRFKDYEQQAQKNKLRIWSNKNYVTTEGFNDSLTITEIANPTIP